MPNIMQDKYILGQSQSGSVASIGQEIRLDLQLQPSTNTLTGGNVSGIVTDSSGNPIPNALVKIMDSNYTPLMHDITDATGAYSFTNIPANQTYNIFATASGMNLNQGNQFTVSQYQDLTINFTLTPDSAMTLGVIAGDLVDQSNNQPINGAVVSLYLINADGSKTIQAITYTNQYGQYTFREVPQGNYSVEITALGYNTTTANVTINQPGQLVPMDVTMVQNPNTSRGTVSGIITDNNNQPINRADVILYKVNADGSLTPVAFTKTTTSGIYLFANVDAGSYKVKSNQAEITSITISVYYSPYFNYFLISNYTQMSTSAVNGVLAGGAKLESAGQLVGYIGGPTGGSTTISAIAPAAGNYIMGIQYINGDATARGLLVDVNGTSTGTTYSCPTTSGWNLNNSLIFNIPITLIQGANLIKLYNISAYGPSVGRVYFAPVSSVNGIDGTMAGGAVVSTNPDFVSGIGDAGGTLTINPNVSVSGEYTLAIKYLAGDNARPLQVSVNGTPTGTTYNLPKTTDWSTANAGTFNVTVKLTAGANTIEFFNSPNAAGPWVGTLTMKPVLKGTYYNATTATLAGSATITNGFVSGIQSKNGSITFDATVPSAGQYNFGIGYVALDNNKQCNIDVNGVSTNQTYGFSSTTNLTAASTVYKMIQLTLIAGANTIKVYNQ